MKTPRGFTLVEILVVIVIIGLMAGITVLAIGKDPQRALQQEAQRARTVLQLAADEALLMGKEHGLVIHKDGYQVVQFNEQKRQWQPGELPAFDQYRLPNPLQLSLQSEGTKVDLRRLNQSDEQNKEDSSHLKPALLLLSSGEITPFAIQFSTDNLAKVYTLSSDGVGEIKLGSNNE